MSKHTLLHFQTQGIGVLEMKYSKLAIVCRKFLFYFLQQCGYCNSQQFTAINFLDQTQNYTLNESSSITFGDDRQMKFP